MEGPVIRFEGVVKSFGAQRVLDGLDFEVERGRCLAIMGPSGSGKSVILRHAVGLMKPDAGRVLVEGREVSALGHRELAELRRGIGFLFQEGALINWLSVRDNVALPLRENTSLSEAEIAERVEAKLDLVRIARHSFDKMPAQISGGMKKRVGLARALVVEPRIILYDEPNAGLDPEISGSINQTIREIQDRLGTTSIVVEHRVACIKTVADSVLFLEKGRAHLQLPPAEFFASSDPRLRQFLGADPD